MRIAVAAVVVLAWSATLVAHTVVPAEFREVVSQATLIVRGRVTDVRSVDATVPGQGVDSIATVLVESLLKGQASSFVYVRVPGGTIGTVRYTMVGAPTFKAGQRAVFFLKPGVSDTTTYRPVGLTMGLYRIQAEPLTKRQVVEPPLLGGRTTAAVGPSIRGDVRRKLMPVAEFESLVRLQMASKVLAAPRGGR
jgi:hypothetical protein